MRLKKFTVLVCVYYLAASSSAWAGKSLLSGYISGVSGVRSGEYSAMVAATVLSVVGGGNTVGNPPLIRWRVSDVLYGQVPFGEFSAVLSQINNGDNLATIAQENAQAVMLPAAGDQFILIIRPTGHEQAEMSPCRWVYSKVTAQLAKRELENCLNRKRELCRPLQFSCDGKQCWVEEWQKNNTLKRLSPEEIGLTQEDTEAYIAGK